VEKRRTLFYSRSVERWQPKCYAAFDRAYQAARALRLDPQDAGFLAFLDARPLAEPFKLFEEPLPAWLQERPL